MGVDITEQAVYEQICSHDGILAKDIGRAALKDKHTVNQFLYGSPFMKKKT